jgi:hypothetical protein
MKATANEIKARVTKEIRVPDAEELQQVDFVDFDEIRKIYYEGVASVAEFCGRIDMLKASGLTPSEAKEAAFVLTAMQKEEQAETENRIL